MLFNIKSKKQYKDNAIIKCNEYRYSKSYRKQSNH